MPEERQVKVKSALTCPECRGPLWEERQGPIVEFSCRVGHKYSPLGLAQGNRETVERTLWSALVAMEEAVDIAERSVQNGHLPAAQAAKQRAHVETLRKMLAEFSELTS